MIRKTRSDKGKKRIGTRIKDSAKYAAGLYAGSKLYGAGDKLGRFVTDKVNSRIAPNANPNSLVGKGKKVAAAVGTLVIADQTVKGVNRLIEKARKRRERK